MSLAPRCLHEGSAGALRRHLAGPPRSARSWTGRRIRKYVRSSSLSNSGGGEPLPCIARWIFGTRAEGTFSQVQLLQENSPMQRLR